MSSKKNQRDKCTVRFAVQADDGRRSREWRLWTYSSKRPSDETYLAPRDYGDALKVSMHADGLSQFGPGPKMRGQLASIDRQALDRWRDGLSGRWRVAYSVFFPHSELRLGSPSEPGVIEVPASSTDQSVLIQVVIAEDQTSPSKIMSALGGDGRYSLVASLPRKSGGAVHLLASPSSLDASHLTNAAVLLAKPHKMWRLPFALGTETGHGTYSDVDTDTKRRFAIEVAVDSDEAPVGPLIYERFRGSVRPWSEVPSKNPPQVCSILSVERDGAEKIFVNENMRCQHEKLFTRAHEILDAFYADGPDSGWNPQRDGRWTTELLPPELAERQWEADPRLREASLPGWTYKGPQAGSQIPKGIENHIRENTLSEAVCVTNTHILYDVERPQPSIRVGFRRE